MARFALANPLDTLLNPLKAARILSDRIAMRSGFTLVELAVATAVLLVVGLSILTSRRTGLELIQTSQDTSAAMGELRAAMDTALILDPASLPIAGSAYANGQPIAAFEERLLDDQRIVVTYPDFVPGDPVPTPLVIRLDITWTDFRGRERTLWLTSMAGP